MRSRPAPTPRHASCLPRPPRPPPPRTATTRSPLFFTPSHASDHAPRASRPWRNAAALSRRGPWQAEADRRRQEHDAPQGGDFSRRPPVSRSGAPFPAAGRYPSRHCRADDDGRPHMLGHGAFLCFPNSRARRARNAGDPAGSFYWSTNMYAHSYAPKESKPRESICVLIQPASDACTVMYCLPVLSPQPI